MSLPYQEWRLEVGAPDHGGRLDAFIGRRLRWRSRAGLRRAIDADSVAVRPYKDPQRAPVGRIKPGLRLRAGQEVIVRLPAAAPRERRAGAAEGELLVVYEDEQLLAVNKPPLVSVYPSRRHRTGSLIERVHQLHRLGAEPHHSPPTLCHRLDRETSGLVLFAKDRATRAELSEQFTDRRIRKLYLALVRGTVEGERGTIDLPLGRADGSAVEIKMGVRRDRQGLPAQTDWRVLRRLPSESVLELEPRTGRQHQLRVHLAAVGHPIVGDKLYLGGDRLFLRSLEGALTAEEEHRLGHGRLALHALRLELRHPATGSWLVVEAPLWPDLAQRLERAGAAGGATRRSGPGRGSP